MYPSPGYVISTPRILPVTFTSSNILPTGCVSPSTTTSVSDIDVSSSSIKLPSMTLPAPPSPPPPKN